ncbi:glycosyltransferase [Catalinimonas niigatensis]|uniref:glycosyltransferase n=1 Tax=Catalinimonas niigatensis TaxID=1397264 RepID=UPI002665BDD2|nr:glycosyltransferase [Catalinimonas niigatensis]WPP49603.1 glycosyltransferase [Catalinimonas niigatensis]
MENHYAIVTPCYNENETIIKFLLSLEDTLRNIPYHFTVVVVNDCSTDHTLDLLSKFRFKANNLKLDLLSLRVNLGHQGAIHQGLLYAKGLNVDKFIVMDSDGEDDPHAILNLLVHQEADIVHVVRGKRNERIFFRIAYFFYKLLFRAITKKDMNFGNFCMINRRVLNAATHTSFIHFAAFLSKVRGNHAYITCDRQKRIGGESKMKTSSLIYHAFKSLTEYAEDLLMLFLKLFIFLATCFVGLIGYIFYQKFFTDDAILGWASTMSVGLFNTALIAIGFYVIGIILLNISHYRNISSREPLYERIPSKNEHEYLTIFLDA